MAQTFKQELADPVFWRAVMVEIISTFILLTVQCSLPLSWKADMGQVIQIALGMGLVVMGLIEMFGAVGDAHFNPAVTLAMLVANKCSIVRGKFNPFTAGNSYFLVLKI